MRAAIFLLAGCVLLAGCSSSNDDNEPPQQATSAHVPAKVVMSDLAASACENAGGTLALSRQLDGSAIGMCQLANGRRCGESALASGSCAR
ncbi:putative hemolysin [Erwinia sp. CGal63]|uniref:putative hemolysin n=1 Tax=Erwinia sp. CGal63 TaxID=2919889 RepID=UPI0030089B4B